MLGGSGVGKSTISTKFGSSAHSRNIKCRFSTELPTNYTFVKVTVVNVEKEINICLNETHSKLLFVDHAYGEISVNCKRYCLRMRENNILY